MQFNFHQPHTVRIISYIRAGSTKVLCIIRWTSHFLGRWNPIEFCSLRCLVLFHIGDQPTVPTTYTMFDVRRLLNFRFSWEFHIFPNSHIVDACIAPFHTLPKPEEMELLKPRTSLGLAERFKFVRVKFDLRNVSSMVFRLAYLLKIPRIYLAFAR